MCLLRTTAVVLGITIQLLLLAGPALGQSELPRRPWTLRPQIGGVGVSGDSFIGVGPGRVSIRTEEGGSLGLALERRFSQLLGLELSVLFSDPSIVANFQSPNQPENRIGTIASLGMTPISLGLNFHPIPGGKVDLYLGPVLSYIIYDDFGIYVPGVPPTLEIDNETTYGFQIGLDLRVGRGPWAFNTDLRWLRAKPATDALEAPSIDIDPLFFVVGFGYSF